MTKIKSTTPMNSLNRDREVKKGDMVMCYKALPYGRSGKREVLSIAYGHSVYVRLTKKDSAYQNREPHQDYWQIMWNNFKPL